MLFISNVKVPDGDGWGERDVLIDRGRYKRICRPGISVPPPGSETLQGEGMYLVPGAVDPHVHVREPGYNHKEDWETCSKAALKGGVCAIFDMPNNKDPVAHYAQLTNKKKIALEKSLVNFGLYIALTDDNIDTVEDEKVQGVVSGVKVYLAKTTGGLLVRSDRALLAVFGQSKAVLVHTGGPEGLDRVLFYYGKAKRKYPSVPVLYICHVSTSEEVALIEKAKQEFHELFAEATPHHLFLHRKNYPDYGSVLPNLAGPEDAKLLLQAVERGVIDIMGTDHAPHTVEEKRSGKPPSGFPGLETALPLLFTSYLDGSLTLESFVRFTSSKARLIIRMGPAAVEETNAADYVLLETGDFRVGADGYETKCGWSPFHGRKVKARVAATVMNGRLAYRPGSFSKTGARLITT